MPFVFKGFQYFIWMQGTRAWFFDSLTWDIFTRVMQLAPHPRYDWISGGLMEVPAEIQARYLQRRKQDLETCIHSLQVKNFNELEKVGHQLKGNGETFGYAELSVIGRHLEYAAHQRDMEELEKVLENFSSWVSQHPN